MTGPEPSVNVDIQIQVVKSSAVAYRLGNVKGLEVEKAMIVCLLFLLMCQCFNQSLGQVYIHDKTICRLLFSY